MSWLRRPGSPGRAGTGRRMRRAPAALTAALGRDEPVTGLTATRDQQVLAASRFGLWVVHGEHAERWDWHLISKARLADRVLSVTVADEVGRWPDGTVLLADRPAIALRPGQSTKLTDTVHHRVRRSVAASRHLDWPGAGGWVVLRRVPGRDGLTVQLRLDAGTTVAAAGEAAGFAAAVAATADELWPAEVPRSAAAPDRSDHPGMTP